MRSIATVSPNLPGSAAKPGADRYTTRGASTMPTAAAASSARNSAVETQSTSARVASGDSRLRTSPRIGTKACENAPSANRRRIRLGMRRATKKASVARPAPNSRAMTKSRTKPRILDNSVMLLTVPRARSMFMLEFAPFLKREQVHGKHQIRPQTRSPGSRAAQQEHEPAHRGAQRDQGRQEGDRRGRQESRRRRPCEITSDDRPRCREEIGRAHV